MLATIILFDFGKNALSRLVLRIGFLRWLLLIILESDEAALQSCLIYVDDALPTIKKIIKNGVELEGYTPL